MNLKTEKAVNLLESESRDVLCVDAQLGICSGGEGVSEEVITTHDESVGNQVCLEDPEFSRKTLINLGFIFPTTKIC